MLDSHCHLDFAEFDAARAELLAEARALGIEGWLVPGVHEGSWDAQEALVGEEGVRLAVGLHPWWVQEAGLLDAALARLEQRARRLHAVAWGECGLDAKRGQVDVAGQLPWFEAQLELARAAELPLVVHQVGAREEFLQALSRCGGLPRGGVIHGFSGDAAWAHALVQRGFHLGFGAAALDARRARLQEAWRAVPLSAILLETDAPAGPRGQHSTPADLARIVRGLADLRGLAAEDLVRTGDENLARLLGLEGPEAFARGRVVGADARGSGRGPEGLL